MKGHHALRTGRFSIENQVYLITATTYKRTPIFNSWDAASNISRMFNSPSVLKTSELLAWVIMPDHVHFLISVGASDSLSHAIGRIKASSTRRLHARRFAEGQIWEGAFHDRAIRREDDILPAARYIVANPLRAGLVRRVGDYPFWNAVWL